MNKNELLEYLHAVCDGENALYACNEAISTIQGELNALHYNTAVKPSEPVWIGDNHYLKGRKLTVDDVFEGGAAGALLGGILGLVVAIAVHSFAFAFISIPCGAIIGGVLGTIIGPIIFADSDHRKQTEQRNAAYNAHLERMHEYRIALREYEQKSDIDKKIEQKLLDMIEENNRVSERIRNQLDNLYSRNIVYERFRNMVAITQILEYLEMGLCDDLTGANGAYAQYMLDVRTDKICDSIHSLKQAMRNMMNQLLISQGQIVNEIRKTNDNMQSLGTTLKTEITGIKDQIGNAIRTAEQTNNRLDSTNTYLMATNSKIEQMNNILSASAHNQYIALRESSMNNYMLKNPNKQ